MNRRAVNKRLKKEAQRPPEAIRQDMLHFAEKIAIATATARDEQP